MTSQIFIDDEDVAVLDGFPTNQENYDFLALEASSEVGAKIIGLGAALDLAFQHNDDYQAQKERLYLEALALTLDRYQFTPIFDGRGGAAYQWDYRDQFVSDMQALTGMAEIASGSPSESITAQTGLGARYLLRSGGEIALNLTNNFTRFLTGDVGEARNSALIGSITQPLLRGAGSAVAAETLMQAERDLLYQLRSFTRFRKQFAVNIASQYYSVLLNREAVINNFAGLNANNLQLERERAFQAEGLRTLLQVGRLEQSSLQLDLRWTASITRYKRSLDNFKLLLGLTANDNIVLDPTEMTLIAETGMMSPELSRDEAVELALQTRLDLYTQLDLVQDAARKIRVAANALRPGVDLTIAVSVPDSGNSNLGELDFEDAVYGAGLDFDLGLDRRVERNNYRRTLINYESARRAYLLASDNVKLDVIDAWRRMTEARKSFEINQTSVQINERRVEEAELRAELGLGDVQDTVDSQNDLTAARTELTRSIVNHNIAKLEFWRDVGLLYVRDDGSLEEGVTGETQGQAL
jgi:outer membrane protein TolC